MKWMRQPRSPQPDHPGNMLPLFIRALATWRLAHMFMYEAGPWDLMLNLRTLAGVRHDPDGTPIAYPDGSVFECFLCFSVWTGIVSSSIPLPWAWPFGLSALAIWAEKVYKHGTR